MVFHYTNIPQFIYSFYCWWTFRFLSVWGYFKQCWYKCSFVFWHRYLCISVGYISWSGTAKSWEMLMFRFDRYCQIISRAVRLTQTPTSNVWKFQLLYILVKMFFILAILVGIYLTIIAICISLMISEVGHLFICLLVIWKSSLVRCLLKLCAHFSTELTISFLLIFRCFLDIVDPSCKYLLPLCGWFFFSLNSEWFLKFI